MAEPAHQPEERPFYVRSWALDDIHILRSADGGDGRTVEAYITPFDIETEITDQHGHYKERIHRAAFNRQLGLGLDRVGVYYHHGLTLHGTPSDLGSVPIGSPKEVRPDGRGLRAIDRYNQSPLADAVLEAIRNGDIRGYSFRGRIFKSNPARIPKVRPGAPLPTVTRMELGLTEYGPTPSPAYADAGIMAVRSLLERLDLFKASTTPHGDQETSPATPNLGPGTEDQPDDALVSAHSGRLHRLRFLAAVRDEGL